MEDNSMRRFIDRIEAKDLKERNISLELKQEMQSEEEAEALFMVEEIEAV